MTKRSPKSGFPFVTFTDPEQVIGRTKVDSCKDLSRAESVEKLVDQRERVAVSDRNRVDSTIIDTEAYSDFLISRSTENRRNDDDES